MGNPLSVQRNPMIADVFYRTGLIERWGRGTSSKPVLELRTANIFARHTLNPCCPPADWSGLFPINREAGCNGTERRWRGKKPLNGMNDRRERSLQGRSTSEKPSAEKWAGWADDLKLGLEREIKELDRQIKEARHAATAALTLEEKLAGQKQIKALESQPNAKLRTLFDALDEIDRRREQLIGDIEGKLQQRVARECLFSIRWTLV